MSRKNLFMAVAVASGVVGCAHCDTCDDFPVPCVGPNCGQLMPGGVPGYLDATAGQGQGQGPAVMGAAPPAALAARSVDDPAGRGPSSPSDMTPAAAIEPASPPAPMEPPADPS